MSLELVALLLLMAGLVAYAVLGGADFGAGFWDLTAGGDRRGARVRGMVARSMTPVWEANHVWLVFVIVILWTAFPVLFGSVFSTLYLPLFGAIAGIIVRGVAFALRGQAATMAEARVLGAAFAAASLFVPFLLGAALGGIASGRVPVGNAGGAVLGSWLNPTSIVVGLLGVATGAHLAAVYMAADSRRAGLADLERAFRARALGSGLVAGALAVGALPVLASDAPALWNGLGDGAGLACVIGSGVAGVATLGLVATGRSGAARFTGPVAVAAVVAGWAVAQSPFVLPGELTLAAATASDTTLRQLMIALGIGAVVLVPSLVLLYRLVLRGVLDSEYEPIDRGLTGPEREP